MSDSPDPACVLLLSSEERWAVAGKGATTERPVGRAAFGRGVVAVRVVRRLAGTSEKLSESAGSPEKRQLQCDVRVTGRDGPWQVGGQHDVRAGHDGWVTFVTSVHLASFVLTVAHMSFDSIGGPASRTPS